MKIIDKRPKMVAPAPKFIRDIPSGTTFIGKIVGNSTDNIFLKGPLGNVISLNTGRSFSSAPVHNYEPVSVEIHVVDSDPDDDDDEDDEDDSF